VIAIDRNDSALRRARTVGAAEALTAGSELAREVRDLTAGVGADVVVEATGTPGGVSDALGIVRPRGRIAVKTTCGLPAEGFDLTRAVVDEITLVGSRCGPFPKALAMLAESDVDVAPLVEAEFALARLGDALAVARECAKVLVRP